MSKGMPADCRFSFNDVVYLRTVVYPGFGSFSADSYRVMLSLNDKLHDISQNQQRSGKFYSDFVRNEGMDVSRTTDEGRIVYIYEAELPVEVHVLSASDHDPDELCPLIDRVTLLYHQPTVDVKTALSTEDVERLLAQMDLIIHTKAQGH